MKIRQFQVMLGHMNSLFGNVTTQRIKNAFFESKNTEIQIAQILLHNGNADEYKEKYPKLYDNAAGLDLNDDELFNRSVMLSNIQAQLSHIDSYEEFISI